VVVVPPILGPAEQTQDQADRTFLAATAANATNTTRIRIFFMAAV
jgi:hypothetical protein